MSARTKAREREMLVTAFQLGITASHLDSYVSGDRSPAPWLRRAIVARLGADAVPRPRGESLPPIEPLYSSHRGARGRLVPSWGLVGRRRGRRAGKRNARR